MCVNNVGYLNNCNYVSEPKQNVSMPVTLGTNNKTLTSDVFQKNSVSMDIKDFYTMDSDYQINNIGATVKIVKQGDDSYAVYTLGSRYDSQVEKKVISEAEFQEQYASDVESEASMTDTETKIAEDVKKKAPSVFNKFKTVYSGNLNSKEINLSETSDGITVFSEKNVEGEVGGKNIQVKYKGSSFKGNYAGNEFDLELKAGGFLGYGKTRTITGVINGENFELDLKGSNIPANPEYQDIVETILVLNGESAKTKNGKFNGVEFSKWNIEQQNMECCVMMMNSQMNAQPPVMPSYTPTWHYENPMAPLYY